MADIEAIHALQRLRHAQRPLQLLCCLLVILQRQAALAQALVEQLHGIISRQLQQLTLHAALRLQQLHLTLRTLSQPHFDELLLLGLRQVRQHNFPGNKGCLIIILLHERRHDFARLIALVLQKEVVTANQPALAHKENLHARACHILRKAKDVHIAAVVRHGLLRLVEAHHCLQLVAQACSLLEGIIIRRLLHPLLQVALQLRRASVQHHAHRANHLLILRTAHITGAGRKTALDMVVEARPVGIHLTAGTQRKHAAQKLHRRMHRSGVGIGAVILRPVTALAARHEQPRKFLVHRHLKIGIGFVVLKADVIARTIFFNQVAL